VEATARYRSTRAGQRNADPEARIVLASLIPGRSPEPTREARVTMALGLVALFVLVIACANVTNLLLARGIQRRRQYAVQSALGMRRSRVIIQLLTETLVLAVLGGGVAILMAGLAGPVLIRTLLPDGAVTATGGTRAVLATTLLVTVTTLLVAVLPSWRASRVQLLDALRSRSASRGIALLRRSLLGVQAALSMVLLVGAGLFVRSLHGAATLDVGLSQDVLLIDLELEGGTRSGDPVAQTVYSLLERLRADPAIESAAGTSLAPWSGMWGLEMDLPGPDSFASGVNGPMFYAATGDYFQTMGLAIVRGRPLTDGDDRENAAPVAVVNETMANSAWPGRDPVGQCLLIGAGEVPCTEVVGVVRDHLPSLTAASARPTYYLAPHHAGIGFVAAQSIVVRPRGVPAPLVPILRATIREAAPHVRYADVGLLADTIDRQMVSWRLGATLLTIFGILALLVAGAGFYGVIAFDVAQRRFELSVRSVLGAPRVRLLRTVIGRAVVVTLTGMAIGLAGAAALGRFIAPMLFRVSPTDPIVYAIVCITLVSAAVIAGLGPALRAIRSDPAVALRE
jgi:predicted permease